MTREEAKEILENWNLCHYTPSREAAEAVISALDPLEIISALRPVSREQVEKVWRGEWIIQQGEHKEYIKRCSKCGFPISGWWSADKFCANCGAPMTDEAVDILLKRLEVLHETVE